MNKKIIFIIGQSGPQGKSYLSEKLLKEGFSVLSFEELTNYDRSSVCKSKTYNNICNGLENGFIVINFTNTIPTNWREQKTVDIYYKDIIESINNGANTIEITDKGVYKINA